MIALSSRPLARLPTRPLLFATVKGSTDRVAEIAEMVSKGVTLGLVVEAVVVLPWVVWGVRRRQQRPHYGHFPKPPGRAHARINS